MSTTETESYRGISLHRKLVEIMGEVNYVEKRGENTAQHYTYQRASDLAHAVRKKLSKRGVLMLSDIEKAERYTIPTKDPSRPMNAIDLTIRYTFIDADTGERESFRGYGTGADSGDKAANKAQTAALKYAIRNAFLVPDEKGDPEADRNTDRQTAQAPLVHVKGIIASEDMKGENFWWKVQGEGKEWAVYSPEESLVQISEIQGRVGYEVELLCFEETTGKKKIYKLTAIREVSEQIR